MGDLGLTLLCVFGFILVWDVRDLGSINRHTSINMRKTPTWINCQDVIMQFLQMHTIIYISTGYITLQKYKHIANKSLV